MLRGGGASLPQYLDVERQRVVAHSLHRWALLRCSLAPGRSA
jgi:hypothetical protein